MSGTFSGPADAGKGGTEPAAILIAGPTASGKSALALRLAAQLGGTIINADSMQVYRDLCILTARPTPADAAATEHRLFGTVDGAVNYSVGKWLADVGEAIAAVRAAGRRPILVGGTGMYFKALTQGLSDIPPVPDAIRERVRTEAAGRTSADLHERLAARDPIMAARLRPSDPQRILRALEVIEATGLSLSNFQGARARPFLAPGTWIGVFVAPERAALAETIDRRFVAMTGSGAIGEVEALAERGLDAALPVMRAHGVPGLIAHLRGGISLDEAVARGQRDTRQYAKRQFTFARHQLPDFAWVRPDEAQDLTLRGLSSMERLGD